MKPRNGRKARPALPSITPPAGPSPGRRATCSPSGTSSPSPPKRPDNTFLTSIHELDNERLQQYYTEINQGFQDLDGNLEQYIRKKTDTCMNRYNNFIKYKASQLITTHFQQIIVKKEEEQALQIEAMQRRIRELESRAELLKDARRAQEQECVKAKARTLRAEEDNAFLQDRIKEHLSENKCIKAVLRDVCKRIELAAGELRLDLSRAADLPMETQEDDETTGGHPEGKAARLVADVYRRIKKFGAEKTTLGNLLEELFPKQPADFKRCKSTTPHRMRVSRILDRCRNPVPPSTAVPVPASESRDIEERFIKQIEGLKTKNVALRHRVLVAQSRATLAVSRQNEIEEAFLDCVEETKKLVFRRRFGAGKQIDAGHVDPTKKLEVSEKVGETIAKMGRAAKDCGGDLRGYQDFSPEDKLNLVTLFVCNEKVLLHIYKLLFPEHSARVESILSVRDRDRETEDQSAAQSPPRTTRLKYSSRPAPGAEERLRQAISRNTGPRGSVMTEGGRYRISRLHDQSANTITGAGD